MSELRADEPMTPEQQAMADSLSPELVKRIDLALLSNATYRNRKVSMLVGLVMADPDNCVAGLPDLYYASRVRVLVETGALVGFGNLDHMRYSEVRLPA